MNKMVIILAGYEQNMADMLSVNPGLNSRFAEKIHFPDFSPGAVQTMLSQKIADEKLVLDDSAAEHLATIAEQLIASPNFSNGRDVNNYFKKLFSQVASRYAVESLAGDGTPSEERQKVTVSDLGAALEQLLKIKAVGTAGERQTQAAKKKSLK